jgi:DHA2 family multidrug resistance protein
LYFVQLDFFHVAIAQFVMGLGVAFFFMPIMTIFLSDLSGNEIAAGSGLTTFMRTVAGSFAASITTFMWEQRAAVQHARLTEHITPYNDVSVQAIDALKQATGSTQAALAVINQSITQQAYQIAFNELFYAIAIIFFLLIPIIWTTKPPFAPKGGDGGGGH